MWHVLSALTRMLAPVLSFTAEEIWQEMIKIDASLPESVFLSDWPDVQEGIRNQEIEAKWEKALVVRGAVSRVLELARSGGIIGHALDARVEVETHNAASVAASFSEEDFKTFTIVSGFRWVDQVSQMSIVQTDEETGIRVGVDKALGEKCPRCWQYTETPDAEGLCPRCSRVLQAPGDA